MLNEIPSSLVELIRSRLGVEESIVGKEVLQRIVSRELIASGMECVEDYVQTLSVDETLFMQLAEELLVPESWFFRDDKPFEWLAQWVTRHWLKASPQRPLRILSVPCAGGQEPYSIVITLLECGLQPEQFVVESGDYSERSLAAARNARYRPHAFRGANQHLRARYFQRTTNGEFELDRAIRSQVRFQRFNLVEANCFSGLPLFDVIFCRNVLIYLHDRARTVALANVRRCLQDDGRMFAGHADSIQTLSSEFVTDGDPAAFCYRLRQSDPVVVPQSTGGSSPWVAASRLQVRRKSVRQHRWQRANSDKSAAENSWRLVQQLADSGQLEQAATACAELLALEKTSIDGHVLHGTIQLALRNPQIADRAFRRALFLDPGNPEALLQLALLAERRGSLADARRWRARLNRVAGSLGQSATVAGKEGDDAK